MIGMRDRSVFHRVMLVYRAYLLPSLLVMLLMYSGVYSVRVSASESGIAGR
jgi:hypothetical protein